MTGADEREIDRPTALFSELLGLDDDEAQEFVALHPDVRRVASVEVLVAQARGAAAAGDDAVAAIYESYARLLCGQAWQEGPALVADLSAGLRGMSDADDPETLRSLISTARPVVAADGAGVVPAPMLDDLRMLASSLLYYAWQLTGDLDALRDAATAQRRLVDATPVDSPCRPIEQAALARRLSALSRELDDRAQLEEAVALWRETIESASDGTEIDDRSDMAEDLIRLAFVTGKIKLLWEAIEHQRAVVAALSADDPRLPLELSDLVSYLGAGYELLGRADLLDEAARLYLELSRLPVPPEHHSDVYDNIASHLARQHAATGDPTVLADAVTAARAAAAATVPTNGSWPTRQNNLAIHLGQQFLTSGDQTVLNEAIVIARHAVAATPNRSTELPTHLNTLAGLLTEHYIATGNTAGLVEAIEAQRQVLRLVPDLAPNRGTVLNNLALQLARLYTETRDVNLLREAIVTQQQAVDASPDTSVSHARNLLNLTGMLRGLYIATGDRSALDYAVDIQRDAVVRTRERSPERVHQLGALAAVLAAVHAATGDPEPFEEALALQRDAVSLAIPGSVELGRQLTNLASLQGDLYRRTGQLSLLEEAVARHREVVGSSAITHTEISGHLAAFAGTLAEVYRATGEAGALDEAIATQRRAADASSAEGIHRATWILGLVELLMEAYEARGRSADVAEIRSLIDDLEVTSPNETAELANARAWLARLDGELGVAAAHIEVALRAYGAESSRLADDVIRRRDLAGLVEGYLGDLVVTLVAAGDVASAVAAAEAPRTWLHAPAELDSPDVTRHSPVAWVATSRWDTAVVTTTDHVTYESHLVSVSGVSVRRAVLTVLSSIRHGSDQHRSQAFEELLHIVEDIAACFPVAEELLIVPLGLTALLPFAAAADPRGGHLVDQCALTLAPSLAWARAAKRRRPGGPSIGAFNPGSPPLDLTGDAECFRTTVGGEVLTEPSGAELMDRLSNDLDIAHVSCHALYDLARPLASALLLATPLTLETVIERSTGPWLVNLSACETSVPDLWCAEQCISFPTSFLFAGSAHVLATLWPVADEHATAVNSAFYHELARGKHPAAALRAAIKATKAVVPGALQRSVTADADQRVHLPFDHPFWWAPFTHYGSPW